MLMKPCPWLKIVLLLAAVFSFTACASVTPQPAGAASGMPVRRGALSRWVSGLFIHRTKYAVLFNADTSTVSAKVHAGNITHAYKTLRAHGFAEQNIFILSPKNPRGPLAMRSDALVTSPGSRLNLDKVVDRLAQISTRRDLVLIYTTGHGVQNKGDSWLEAQTSPVSRYFYSGTRFRQRIPRIPSATTVVVMDQCYSGGFSMKFKDLDTTTSHIIAIANTDDQHTTYCEYFAAAFWDAFGDRRCDLNGDGAVSVDEAYEAAMKVHRKKLARRDPGEVNGQYTCTGGVKDTWID